MEYLFVIHIVQSAGNTIQFYPCLFWRMPRIVTKLSGFKFSCFRIWSAFEINCSVWWNHNFSIFFEKTPKPQKKKRGAGGGGGGAKKILILKMLLSYRISVRGQSDESSNLLIWFILSSRFGQLVHQSPTMCIIIARFNSEVISCGDVLFLLCEIAFKKDHFSIML